MRRAPHTLRGSVITALLLASALITSLPSRSRADQWLIAPGRDVGPAKVTLELAKSGLGVSLSTLLAAIQGSSALAHRYRLIDLDTGEVLTLSALEVAQITWVDGSGVVNAGDAAADGTQLVLVLSDFGGMGASIVTLEDGMVTVAEVLSADQRLLVGEPPCDEGFAPESDFSGTICADIDECAAMLDDCATHASCSNTDGSYKCTCDDGYEGDGTMCVAPGMMAEDAAVADPDGGLVLDDSGLPLDPDASISEGMSVAADSGCGCRTVGHDSARGPFTLLSLAGLVLATTTRLRRRTRR